MSDLVRHKDRPALPADDPAAVIKLSYWPKEHDFSGGNHGGLVMRDTASSDGASWLQSVATGVLTAQGAGTAPAYSLRPLLDGVVLPLTDPSSPPDGLLWITATGVTPAMTIQIKVRVAGVTYTVLSAGPF